MRAGGRANYARAPVKLVAGSHALPQDPITSPTEPFEVCAPLNGYTYPIRSRVRQARPLYKETLGPARVLWDYLIAL